MNKFRVKLNKYGDKATFALKNGLTYIEDISIYKVDILFVTTLCKCHIARRVLNERLLDDRYLRLYSSACCFISFYFNWIWCVEWNPSDSIWFK